MSDQTDDTAALTTEQQQRLIATNHSARFLRSGGASLANNTSSPGEIADIIDLASYITDGVPFSVAHRHSHVTDAVELIVGPAGGTLSDLLISMFKDRSEPEQGDKDEDPRQDPETPDFDFN
jgi:hypothetical protein